MIHKFNNVKDSEKYFTSCYMKCKYNFIPEFIDLKTELDIPDCYFEYNKKMYAVEVTRYFHQNIEQEHQTYINNIQKYLPNDDFIKQIYIHLGKRRAYPLTIGFYDIEQLKTTIIKNIKYIDLIDIEGNIYNNENKEFFGEIYCIDSDKNKMTIAEFIDFTIKLISKEKEINLVINTKNKYDVSISFKYYNKHSADKAQDKEILPYVLCYFTEKTELYDNILKAINKKNKKLKNEYIPKLKKNGVKFDYYNLVICYEGYPSDLDTEELYNIIKSIDDLKFQEIAIFLWNKIMVINSGDYKVYKTV